MKIHILTTEQLKKLANAIGNGNDFPKMTDDPKVNHAVDCVVLGDDQVSSYEQGEGVYVMEAALFKAQGASR